MDCDFCAYCFDEALLARSWARDRKLAEEQERQSRSQANSQRIQAMRARRGV